jgi:hypothetical protein
MRQCYFGVDNPHPEKRKADEKKLDLLSFFLEEEKKFEDIWPFFLVLSLSYLMGFLGYHVLTFGLFFWVCMKQFIHTTTVQERQYWRFLRNQKLVQNYWVLQPIHLTQSQPQSNAIENEERKEGEEGTHWWNLFMYHLWPHMSTFLAESTQNLLKKSLDSALAANPVLGVV